MDQSTPPNPNDFRARLASVEVSQARLQNTLDTLGIRIADLNDLLAAWTEAQTMIKAARHLATIARWITRLCAAFGALWLLARTGHWHWEP